MGKHVGTKYSNFVLVFSQFQSTQDRLIVHKENSHNSDGMLSVVTRMVRMMAVFVVVVVALLLLMPMVLAMLVVMM